MWQKKLKQCQTGFICRVGGVPEGMAVGFALSCCCNVSPKYGALLVDSKGGAGSTMCSPCAWNIYMSGLAAQKEAW